MSSVTVLWDERAGNSAFPQDRRHCTSLSHQPLSRTNSRPHLIQGKADKEPWAASIMEKVGTLYQVVTVAFFLSSLRVGVTSV